MVDASPRSLEVQIALETVGPDPVSLRDLCSSGIPEPCIGHWSKGVLGLHNSGLGFKASKCVAFGLEWPRRWGHLKSEALLLFWYSGSPASWRAFFWGSTTGDGNSGPAAEPWSEYQIPAPPQVSS